LGVEISEGRLDQILSQVTKPARYTGREWNSVVKDWDRARIKVLLAYPDLYEVGMSNLGLMILYDLLNREDDLLAERAYTPGVDMEEALDFRVVTHWMSEEVETLLENLSQEPDFRDLFQVEYREE